MAKKVALLTLHGMGETKPDYQSGLVRLLQDALPQEMDDVAVSAVNYQKVLQPNQRKVYNRMQGVPGGLNYPKLREFVLFGFADAAGLENGKEEDDSAYVEAQIEIAQKLLEARKAMSFNDGPVVVIAQSLGGQVISSYIYDAQKARSIRQGVKVGVPAGIWKNIEWYGRKITETGQDLSEAEVRFLTGDTIVAIVTTGCNIPIFVAARKEMRIKPIQPPAPGVFRWLNLYDKDDVLGWPLSPLRGGYETLVEDIQINANGRGIVDWLKSFSPLSHEGYWEDEDVIRRVASLVKKSLRFNGIYKPPPKDD